MGIYFRHSDRRYWPGTGIGIEDPVIRLNWGLAKSNEKEDFEKDSEERRASAPRLAHNRRLE